MASVTLMFDILSFPYLVYLGDRRETLIHNGLAKGWEILGGIRYKGDAYGYIRCLYGGRI